MINKDNYEIPQLNWLNHRSQNHGQNSQEMILEPFPAHYKITFDFIRLHRNYYHKFYVNLEM